MKFLTLEYLLELHTLAIARFGGSAGVREAGRLEAALATQEQQVFGAELYPTVYSKAAALMRGVIADHPFFDGNKRTGTLVAVTFLELNGHMLTAQKGELENFAVSVAVDHLDVEVIATWLQAHTMAVPGRSLS